MKHNTLIIHNMKNNTISITKSLGIIATFDKGIAEIHGLNDVQSGELILSSSKNYGLVLNIQNSIVSAKFLSEVNLKVGEFVQRLYNLFNITIIIFALMYVLNSFENVYRIKPNFSYFTANTKINNHQEETNYLNKINKRLKEEVKKLDKCLPKSSGFDAPKVLENLNIEENLLQKQAVASSLDFKKRIILNKSSYIENSNKLKETHTSLRVMSDYCSNFIDFKYEDEKPLVYNQYVENYSHKHALKIKKIIKSKKLTLEEKDLKIEEVLDNDVDSDFRLNIKNSVLKLNSEEDLKKFKKLELDNLNKNVEKKSKHPLFTNICFKQKNKENLKKALLNLASSEDTLIEFFLSVIHNRKNDNNLSSSYRKTKKHFFSSMILNSLSVLCILLLPAFLELKLYKSCQTIAGNKYYKNKNNQWYRELCEIQRHCFENDYSKYSLKLNSIFLSRSDDDKEKAYILDILYKSDVFVFDNCDLKGLSFEQRLNYLLKVIDGKESVTCKSEALKLHGITNIHLFFNIIFCDLKSQIDNEAFTLLTNSEVLELHLERVRKNKIKSQTEKNKPKLVRDFYKEETINKQINTNKEVNKINTNKEVNKIKDLIIFVLKLCCNNIYKPLFESYLEKNRFFYKKKIVDKNYSVLNFKGHSLDYQELLPHIYFLKIKNLPKLTKPSDSIETRWKKKNTSVITSKSDSLESSLNVINQNAFYLDELSCNFLEAKTIRRRDYTYKKNKNTKETKFKRTLNNKQDLLTKKLHNIKIKIFDYISNNHIMLNAFINIVSLLLELIEISKYYVENFYWLTYELYSKIQSISLDRFIKPYNKMEKVFKEYISQLEEDFNVYYKTCIVGRAFKGVKFYRSFFADYRGRIYDSTGLFSANTSSIKFVTKLTLASRVNYNKESRETLEKTFLENFKKPLDEVLQIIEAGCKINLLTIKDLDLFFSNYENQEKILNFLGINPGRKDSDRLLRILIEGVFVRRHPNYMTQRCFELDQRQSGPQYVASVLMDKKLGLVTKVVSDDELGRLGYYESYKDEFVAFVKNNYDDVRKILVEKLIYNRKERENKEYKRSCGKSVKTHDSKIFYYVNDIARKALLIVLSDKFDREAIKEFLIAKYYGSKIQKISDKFNSIFNTEYQVGYSIAFMLDYHIKMEPQQFVELNKRLIKLVKTVYIYNQGTQRDKTVQKPIKCSTPSGLTFSYAKLESPQVIHVKTYNTIFPNFVHSLDASVLVIVSARFMLQFGYTPLTNHDSYLLPIPHHSKLIKMIQETMFLVFIGTYLSLNKQLTQSQRSDLINKRTELIIQIRLCLERNSNYAKEEINLHMNLPIYNENYHLEHLLLHYFTDIDLSKLKHKESYDDLVSLSIQLAEINDGFLDVCRMLDAKDSYSSK